ncbi:MAG: hypothetical protein Q4A83_01955 [Bacillota bacterium]|nr:hypothetical protein [Bacillota bacterium]
MERIIRKPHLPEGEVRCLIIGEKYRNILKNPLKQHNISAICAGNNNFVDERLCGHIDLSVAHMGENRISAAEYLKNSEFVNKLTQLGFDVKFVANPKSESYPDDAAMNVCIIGENVICNPKTASEIVTAGRQILSCKQGYTKCTVAVVDANSIITSDKSIAANSALYGIESLLIDDSFVKLQGFNKGFIGGASFKISRNRIAFTGIIKNDEAKSAIENFLSVRGIEAEYLTDEEIFDIGSAIPIIEEIWPESV